MRTKRIHITGASGSGTTTLGRGLADTLSIPHHDTDDYFWSPTENPYTQKREIADRLRLMDEMFLKRPEWILSGSLDTWAEPIFPFFDVIIFIYISPDIRLERLHKREAHRFGKEAVAPGGCRYQQTQDFLKWAAGYDQDGFDGRNLKRHQAWLETLSCPVLQVDGAQPSHVLVDEVVGKIIE